MDDILSEEQQKEFQKKSGAIDFLLDLLGGSKDGPIDFRLLKADKDFNLAVKDLMKKDGFTKLEDEPKLALINFYQQGIELVKEISSKLEN